MTRSHSHCIVTVPRSVISICYKYFYRRYPVSKRRVIPLPQWKADPETNPEALFKVGQVTDFILLIIFWLYI